MRGRAACARDDELVSRPRSTTPRRLLPRVSLPSIRRRSGARTLARTRMSDPPKPQESGRRIRAPRQNILRFVSAVPECPLHDLPAPYATESAGNGPKVVPRPDGMWPKAPAGFTVQQYATGLDNPRAIRTAPNGDFFVADSSSGKIRIFRGITGDGKPQQTSVFAVGLNQPYGIAFYPPGPDPQWLYIGNTDAVVRFAYRNGDLKASGLAQHIADLPHGGDHWTRDVQFTSDGKEMFVAVGSSSNVDDPDSHPDEKNRADILEFSP